MRERMEITSVNIGTAETIVHANKSMLTGICKRPVSGPIHLGELGLDGDQIVDGKHHGGVDQAIYAYSSDDYGWWAASMDRDFEPGVFGENLTIQGLPTNMLIGDRLLIGDVVLEATSARIPCATLATRMTDRTFGQLFREAERPGIYFRVLNAGELEAGDTVTLVESAAGNVSVLDLFRFAYETSHDREQLRRFLDAPIAERVRSQVEAKLAEL